MESLGFRFERNILRQGHSIVIGCDEVGRGALAGPIVAAAVAFGDEFKVNPTSLKLRRTSSEKLPSLGGSALGGKAMREVRDSKLLSSTKREELVFHIKHYALAWSVTLVSPQVIDKINIHQANLLALYRAVQRVHTKLPTALTSKTHVLIDGRFTIPQWTGAQTAVVDGDAKVFSIAAASILAKVYRDQLMMKQDTKFPGYEFARHKGYGTLLHRQQIGKLGLSAIHRESFCRNIEADINSDR